ncbi:MAG: hypothetical protein WCG66_02995 [bacterium]
MNTLAALEQYNDLCDELDAYMHEENSHLRASGQDQELLVNRKRQILGKLEAALTNVRSAGPVKSADHAASAEVRKRVLAKVLKLLLLSRESEQLLLKNTVRTAPRLEAAQPTPARLASTYKTHKPARAAATQAEGSWVVW